MLKLFYIFSAGWYTGLNYAHGIIFLKTGMLVQVAKQCRQSRELRGAELPGFHNKARPIATQN